jgi:DNA-directed RNA polymerase subunit RPC12/RpoP
MTLEDPSNADTESSYAKTTLFCGTCEHASPVGGDWIADDASEGQRLLCPRCGSVVVDNPALSE